MSVKTLISVVFLVVVVAISVVFIMNSMDENTPVALDESYNILQEKADRIMTLWGEQSTDQVVTVDYNKEYRTEINWESGYIQASARGTVDPEKTVSMADAVVMAEKTARLLAYEKLAETIDGITINSLSVLKDEKLKNSKLMAKVNALIKNAREIAVKHETLSDGSVLATVTLGVLLKGEGGLSVTVLPEVEAAPEVTYTPKETIEVEETEPQTEEPIEINYSGLIIDARGLTIRPAMAPRIVVSDGKVVYNGAKVSNDILAKNGIVSYYKDIEKAKAEGKVGEFPLVIKAKSIDGRQKTDPVVSTADADKILTADAKNGFLGKLQVVIVL